VKGEDRRTEGKAGLPNRRRAEGSRTHGCALLAVRRSEGRGERAMTLWGEGRRIEGLKGRPDCRIDEGQKGHGLTGVHC
jgi:hypothetical protein